MNIENHNQDEAKDILEALRTIQDSPDLQAKARANPESVMDRLNLIGTARHAVAFGVAGMIIAPVIQQFGPTGFWL